jgi:hypothetical protein
MSQEPKQVPIPALTAEQVEVLINYANELPTKYGKEILMFIENIAIEIEKAKEAPKAE